MYRYIQDNYSKIRNVEKELATLALEVKLTAGPKKHGTVNHNRFDCTCISFMQSTIKYMLFVLHCLQAEVCYNVYPG